MQLGKDIDMEEQALLRQKMTDQDRKRIALHDLNRKLKETLALTNYWHTKIHTCDSQYVDIFKDKFKYGKCRIEHLLIKIDQIKNNPIGSISPIVSDTELRP